MAEAVPHALHPDIGLLDQPGRTLLWSDHRIRRGVFKSVPQLVAAIQEYLEQHNADPKPFVWTASVTAILEKVARGRQALESVHSTNVLSRPRPQFRPERRNDC